MSGLAGRLAPGRFGFAMPVTDPPFDRPPYYYRGIEVMGFAYETDDQAAAEIVPEGLTIADLASPPLVTLKVIPSPEEGAPPEVCELVLTPLKFELIVGSDGRGEGFSGPGNLTFDSPSAVDPWHRLPVRRMVAAAWGHYNFVLPYGRVIKRYAVERTAEPVTQLAVPVG